MGRRRARDAFRGAGRRAEALRGRGVPGERVLHRRQARRAERRDFRSLRERAAARDQVPLRRTRERQGGVQGRQKPRPLVLRVRDAGCLALSERRRESLFFFLVGRRRAFVRERARDAVAPVRPAAVPAKRRSSRHECPRLPVPALRRAAGRRGRLLAPQRAGGDRREGRPRGPPRAPDARRVPMRKSRRRRRRRARARRGRVLPATVPGRQMAGAGGGLASARARRGHAGAPRRERGWVATKESGRGRVPARVLARRGEPAVGAFSGEGARQGARVVPRHQRRVDLGGAGGPDGVPDGEPAPALARRRRLLGAPRRDLGAASLVRGGAIPHGLRDAPGRRRAGHRGRPRVLGDGRARGARPDEGQADHARRVAHRMFRNRRGGRSRDRP